MAIARLFPDSRFPIPDSRFPIPVPLLGGVRGGFRFPTPDSQFPIPDSRFPIPDSRFPIPKKDEILRFKD
ncbi:MAG: hypothetical protein F6K37_31015 [Moorea sp. SIO4E2]|uniref:hypothetical protein n=1 Tax=Moorena sp. SIO4E2 TaxID=2607826 RepID=UPI0013BA8679|nr:hypothetical protein [Moorena sp. SIO4E2]NEQ10209.1 hypothetical protein [Moorena sp. SIO4E2]